MTNNGITGLLEIRLTPCIKYPRNNISSKDACTGNVKKLKIRRMEKALGFGEK
ncbi:MAG: hypothetical protein KKF16_05265 [Euryarchaeota archaeon]|nr:hypothetical protein [Euryarchaeota archaeon]MBV1729168.1 hypothetical protein [Methanobacterium sp.]MBV1756197.1 hypothetical protein [Methanobacterium sp.]